MPGNVQISSSTIPVGFCSPFSNADWQFLVGLLFGQADVSTNLHTGEAPPTDLTKYWAREISGNPDKIYKFTSGVWASPHGTPTGHGAFAPGGMTLEDLKTYDGGEDAAITQFTGPMWEEDTRFRAKFPIGPGTFPSGTTISEGDTGGEEKHPLTVPEIPAHSHVLLVSQSETGGGSDVLRLRPNINEEQSDANSADAGGDPTTGIVTPHNTVPPYHVVWFIKKTARRFYRV